jgi:hypothetical protein
MIKTRIGDGGGSGRSAKVLPDQELLISTSPNPPLLSQKTKIFNQFLMDDASSSDMGIDGATTPTHFYIEADMEKDIYITQASFLIGYGASGGLWEWADSGGVLANGIQLDYVDSVGDVTEIANILANSDFLRVALADGNIPTAWELRHIGALNDYGYVCTINLANMVQPYGIKLDRGTKQRLSVWIRDNVSDADTFNCRVYGFERFE